METKEKNAINYANATGLKGGRWNDVKIAFIKGVEFKETPSNDNPSLSYHVNSGWTVNVGKITVRAFGVLKANNIHTVIQLLELSEADFLRFRNAGAKTWKVILDFKKSWAQP